MLSVHEYGLRNALVAKVDT